MATSSLMRQTSARIHRLWRDHHPVSALISLITLSLVVLLASVILVGKLSEVKTVDADMDTPLQPRVLRLTGNSTTQDAAPADLNATHASAGDMQPTGATNEVGQVSADAGKLPFPAYPNAKRYREGDEFGLQVIVFQTEDAFEKVDAYFQQHSAAKGLSRLPAMSDYVRYANADSNNIDPWAHDRPGIVIHEIVDREAAIAAGADPTARTNIIMSFQPSS